MTRTDEDPDLGAVAAQEAPSPTLTLFPKVQQAVAKVLGPLGFEAHPFHIGWYNELVGPRFYLDYPQNTVALVVLSGPEAFEKCVVPFLKSQIQEVPDFVTVDPLDASMKHTFSEIAKELEASGFTVEPIQDFDLHPSRKPKVLVQTAAHVAGAVEYFHRDRLKTKGQSWLKDSKLFGVAIHPDFGGWFAIRGVLILTNLVLENDRAMSKPERPIDVQDESQIAYLLEQFGLHWKTHVWRDVLPRKLNSTYSQDFKDYLATEPGKRWDFMHSRGLLNVTCVPDDR